MQKQLLFLFLMILIPFFSFSQSYKTWFLKWDKKIEIITVNDDTIKGLIASDLYFLGKGLNFKYKTITKKKKDNKKQKIKNKEIKKIIYNGRSYFRKTFTHIDIRFGYLKLIYEHNDIRYYYDADMISTYDSAGNPTGKIDYHFIEIGEEIIQVEQKEKKFFRQMKQLFGDCPEIAHKINSEVYDVYEVGIIIKTYCEWLEQQE
ncbi:MAG: hypothetical protein ACI94Y_000555 [Maribacter sp.]|jgi:hypothetical protein